MAGDYLVSTFADMMHSARFRKHVWGKMQLEERRRLESLRLQALYGDAPADSNPKRSHMSGTAVRDAPEAGAATVAEMKGTQAEVHVNAASPPPTLSSPFSSTTPTSGTRATSLPPAPSAPRWFDIAGRSRFKAWVALRGCMAPDVAAECFCAEFLGVIKKYPHPALLPPVEAALSTAHGLAQRARHSNRADKRTARNGAAPAPPISFPRTSTAPVFQVRALQGDPAALALLWICRAYRIPSEFVVEPLSKALGKRRSVSATPPLSTSPSTPEEHNATTSSAPANHYLPYTMADACYPFSASLMYPATNTSSVSATVTTPETAFVLMADTFLAAYPHWMGVPSDLPASSASTAAPSQTSLQRCSWIDELQHITRHVRTPILALLVHQATQAATATRCRNDAARADLRRAVAAHLHRYESWTMERIVNRRVRQAQSVLSPLLASTAVVDALRHAYAPDAKAVTAADVFVASCGYVLCTHPFCADVFPLLRVPDHHVDGEVVRPRWPSDAVPSTTTTQTTLQRSPTYAPWALPLYLSGLPAEYNEQINRLLRRETVGATQHEQQHQAVRLLLSNNNETTTATMNNNDTGSSSVQPKRSTAYYEVSSASVTKEAAEAVGQLILTRLSSIRNDHLQHDDSVVGSLSSVSGVPFLVLGHVFALAWSLAQEQVPAFPYFMLDGNPDHYGGFTFLAEEAGAAAGRRAANSTGEGGTADPSRARRQFPVSLAPAPAVTAATAAAAAVADPSPVMLPTMVQESAATPSASSLDGGASVESRLRDGLHVAAATLAKGVRRLCGAPHDDETRARQNSSVHATHVLRNEGENVSGSGSSVAACSAADGAAAQL
jgi:hypothetical protein